MGRPEASPRILLLLLLPLLLLPSPGLAQEAGSLCGSAEAQKSCGQCIKQHPDCGWCSDPAMSGGNRCGLANDMATCASDKVYHPKSETAYLRDQQIGGKKPDGVTTVQLQPQQVKISMKPGETVSFPLTYLHGDKDAPRNVYALNSETASNGLQVQYSVNCKGRVVAGPQCGGVGGGEKVVFNVSLTLAECKTQGDAVVSIGIGGLRDVVAVYVTPLCGCACEKLSEQVEKASECGGFGRLVCGACVCDAGRGGADCGCNLAESGAGDQAELEDQCRASSEAPPCSAKGQCVCGQCDCDADYISGQFCECDDTDCPMAEGMTCGGHGSCKCGTCDCEAGWQGAACDCTADPQPCTADDGSVCSGQGMCVCGECECEDGFEGLLCSEETPDGAAQPEPVPEEEDEEVGEAVEDEVLGEPEEELEESKATDALPLLSLLLFSLLASWLRY